MLGSHSRGLTVFPLGSFAFRERRVVFLLRRSMFPDGESYSAERRAYDNLPQSVHAAFAELAMEAGANNLTVFSPGAAFASTDENMIVYRISAMQRPLQSERWLITSPFQRALKRCADALADAGRRLPPRPMVREEHASANPCFEIEYAACSQDADSDQPSAESQLRKGSKRRLVHGDTVAKATALFGGRSLVTTAQFSKAGLNCYHLSLLVKHGYVERASHGLYRRPEFQREMSRTI